MTPLIAGLITAGMKIIEKVVPDPAAAKEAQFKLMELAQKGELAQLEADVKLASGQLEINKVEAASPSLFKVGWRPAIGWIGATSLAYQFIAQPLLAWYSTYAHIPVPPVLDLSEIMTILTGMLGLGVLRTHERVRGVIPRGH